MLVSLYHYGRPDTHGLYSWEPRKDGKVYQPDNAMPFDEWINRNDFYYWTLNRFILDEAGQWLVDRVIRVETLNEEIRFLSEKADLPLLSIPHINKTAHHDYRHYYNDATKDHVKKHFEFDIEIGKYVF